MLRRDDAGNLFRYAPRSQLRLSGARQRAPFFTKQFEAAVEVFDNRCTTIVDELCDVIEYLVRAGYTRGVMSGGRRMANVLREQINRYCADKVYPKILQKINVRMQANGVDGMRIGLVDGGQRLYVADIARSDVQVLGFDNWQ